jgi:hypothetical protein
MPSAEERIARIEQFLTPAAYEAARRQQMATWQALVHRVNADPHVTEMAAHHMIDARLNAGLGIEPEQQAMAEAQAIVANTIGEAWNDGLAVKVAAHLDANAGAYEQILQASLQGGPAHLAHALVGMANTVTAAEQIAERVAEAEAAQRENRRQAQTQSGGSVRPATMSDDEAYWQRVKAAGQGRYASG